MLRNLPAGKLSKTIIREPYEISILAAYGIFTCWKEFALAANTRIIAAPKKN